VSYHNRLDAGYLRMVDKTASACSAARAIRPRYELSPYEYVETLMEVAALLEEKGLANGLIAVLDQVDPLPFMFGLEPPRGNLWSGAGAPVASPADYLAGADRVLIPRFTTNFAMGRDGQGDLRRLPRRAFPGAAGRSRLDRVEPGGPAALSFRPCRRRGRIWEEISV